MSKPRRIPSRPQKLLHVGRLGAVPLPGIPMQRAQTFKARLANISFTEDPDGKTTTELDWEIPLMPGGGLSADPAFDPWSATFEEVVRYYGDVTTPEFSAWASALSITGRRERIEADGIALLEAVQQLLVAGLRAPPWLAEAFRSRYQKFERYEARTLDEAFGHTPLDPRTVAERRKSRSLISDLHGALLEAVAADPTIPIHADHPFEQVGKRFGIGKTKAFELCREAVQEHGMQDLVEYRRVLLFARPVPEK